jgi:hypothetical protein
LLKWLSIQTNPKKFHLAYFHSLPFLFHRLQKHKRKNHCDKNNDSTGHLADLSSNEDDVNIINGDFEKLQVAKPYQIKYSDIYGRFGIFRL